MKVIGLIGRPGSGKSTLAASIARQSEDCEIVEFDAMFDPNVNARQARSNFVFKCVEASLKHQVVVVDDTMHLRSMRRQLERSLSPAVEMIWVYVQASLEECLERNDARTRRVSPNVISNMRVETPPDCLRYSSGDDVERILNHKRRSIVQKASITNEIATRKDALEKNARRLIGSVLSSTAADDREKQRAFLSTLKKAWKKTESFSDFLVLRELDELD